MGFINTTPHAITITIPEGSQTVPPSGCPIRCAVNQEPTNGYEVSRIPTFKSVTGDLEGLNEALLMAILSEDHAVILVSAMVLTHPHLPGDCKAFSFAAPNTSVGVIRDEEGRIEAVTSLIVR